MSGAKKCMVVGATGIVGGNLIQHLLDTNNNWEITAVASSLPTFFPWYGNDQVKCVTVDLLNEKDCNEKLGKEAAQIEFLFYAAYKQSSDDQEMVDVNSRMFKNCLESVTKSAPNLKKICLNTGGKYYGCHKGPFKTPAEEDDPRIKEPMFYYDQEDLLASMQKNKEWTYTITRPLEIIGLSKGYMNFGQSIAVYATMCRELGEKFKYPGSQSSWEALVNFSDVKMIAKLLEHSCFSTKYSNEAFNIVNGDCWRWKYLWPRIAQYFNLEWEGPSNFSLVEKFGSKKELWDKIAKEHNLKFKELDKAATFDFADMVFGRYFDCLLSMNKAREAGFWEWRNSEKMFYQYFDSLKEVSIIPKNI